MERARMGAAALPAADDDDAYGYGRTTFGYGFTMAAIMLALAAVLVVRRLRDSNVRLPWLLLALQVSLALWFLISASTSAEGVWGTPSPSLGTALIRLTYYVDPFFYWVVTTLTLAYAVSVVCNALLGGVRSQGGLVLVSAASVVCVVELALTMAEGKIFDSMLFSPQSYLAAYIYSGCGGACPYIPGSSWYRTLAPLAMPCTNPFVDPVVALVAVLRGALLVGVAGVWLRTYTLGSSAAGVQRAPSDGDPMAYTLMAGAPTAPRTTKVYTWLTRIVVALAFLQHSLLVGMQGPAAGSACSCMDSAPCNGAVHSYVTQLVGRGLVALVPTLAIVTLETWRFWRGDTGALAVAVN